VHVELLHAAFTACAGTGQAFPQLPQFATSFVSEVSQPFALLASQFPLPGLQTSTAHVLETHFAEAFARLHGVQTLSSQPKAGSESDTHAPPQSFCSGSHCAPASLPPALVEVVAAPPAPPGPALPWPPVPGSELVAIPPAPACPLEVEEYDVVPPSPPCPA
jgi:hypothetical protein